MIILKRYKKYISKCFKKVPNQSSRFIINDFRFGYARGQANGDYKSNKRRSFMYYKYEINLLILDIWDYCIGSFHWEELYWKNNISRYKYGLMINIAHNSDSMTYITCIVSYNYLKNKELDNKHKITDRRMVYEYKLPWAIKLDIPEVDRLMSKSH